MHSRVRVRVLAQCCLPARAGMMLSHLEHAINLYIPVTGEYAYK
jgi:hypothetical protein